MQSFIYDFRWLAQSSDVVQQEMEANDFELVAIKQPRKLKRELTTLITSNPRDTKFLQESPKLAKKLVIMYCIAGEFHQGKVSSPQITVQSKISLKNELYSISVYSLRVPHFTYWLTTPYLLAIRDESVLLRK